MLLPPNGFLFIGIPQRNKLNFYVYFNVVLDVLYLSIFLHFKLHDNNLIYLLITCSKLSKNAFSSAVENITNVDVSHTSDSCILSHQCKFLSISSMLTNNITDAKIGLQEMKRNSPDRLILGHVNINSIRNKFDALSYIIGNNRYNSHF